MPPIRRKRLPTDFFDRLLSNQTDDQINDLLTSLVDEQLSNAPDTSADEAASAAGPASAVRKRPKDLRHDRIEDAIVTRDETLEEDSGTAGLETAAEDLIPRTARMQMKGAPGPGRTVVEDLSASGPVRAMPAPEPVIPKPPETEAPAPGPASPGRDLFAYPDYLAGIETEAPPAHEQMPVIDLSGTMPPPPRMPAPAVAPDIGARKPPAAPPRPIAPAPAPAPKTSAPGRIPESAPARVTPSLAEHDELVRARRKMRWQHPPHRKPKVPKLAKPSAPVAYRPPKLALDLFPQEANLPVEHITWSRYSRAALFFLLPAFICFSLFSWYPMIKGLVISFFDYKPSGTSDFVGLANYARAFSDVMFWRTLLHASEFCLMALALGFGLPILLAIFINELRFGKGMMKFLFFLPFLMPTVPAAILWKWIMDQGFGLLNAGIALLGIGNPFIGWLTDPKLALFSIVLLYIWKNTGWAMLIYSAALANMDETLYEEAEMDGASVWHKIWHITVPFLRGVIAVMLIMTVINTLQIFTEVYILTNGGPMNSTEVIATYIYKQAFFYMDIGYASALSVVLLLLLLTITVARLRRLEPEGD